MSHLKTGTPCAGLCPSSRPTGVAKHRTAVAARPFAHRVLVRSFSPRVQCSAGPQRGDLRALQREEGLAGAERGTLRAAPFRIRFQGTLGALRSSQGCQSTLWVPSRRDVLTTNAGQPRQTKMVHGASNGPASAVVQTDGAILSDLHSSNQHQVNLSHHRQSEQGHQDPRDVKSLQGLTSDKRGFRQRFVIRWYEACGHRNTAASIQTMANLMQESAASHLAGLGFAKDGLAATPKMRELGLLWIISKMHICMEEYPHWGDEVEVETWGQLETSISARRDWLFRASDSRLLGRATCCNMLLNEATRRLARIPPEVREEMEEYCPKPARSAFSPEELPKIPSLDWTEPHEGQLCASNLRPRLSDLDMNQHTNNVTYISWMLEALPEALLEQAELVQITVEYRRECGRGDTVQSLARLCEPAESSQTGGTPENNEAGALGDPRPSLSSTGPEASEGRPKLEDVLGDLASGSGGSWTSAAFVHMLRLQDPEEGNPSEWKEINKAFTVWRPLV